MSDIFEYLKEAIPSDHGRQTNASAVLQARVDAGLRPARVLDFGCGDGRSIDLFRRVLPSTEWTGVDIASSPEVANRRRTDGEFVTYDGYELPFPNCSFPLVYSYQVLEHVHKPDVAFREIARVLEPGGLFIGQTSQFEPYHSYSLWNFTVYGFKRLVEEAGLRLVELRPGIDGFTLMRRTYEHRPREMSKYFFQESPVNEEIDRGVEGKRARIRNFRKLMFCGQFAFVVQRVVSSRPERQARASSGVGGLAGRSGMPSSGEGDGP